MLLSILTFVLIQTPQDRAPVKRPEATVTVQDRALEIPALPRDVAQARGAFKATHAQIQAAQQDLAEYLRILYARPEARQALSADLSVPEAFAGEGVVLLNLLQDTRYAQLESAYAEVWKGWQAGLVEGGLSTRVNATAKAGASHSAAYEGARRKALEVIAARKRLGGEDGDTAHASYNVENVDLFGDGTERNTADEQRVIEKMRRSVAVAQMGQAVSNSLMPTLAETWDPLVAHLGAQVRRVGELEAGAVATTDPTVALLRLQAKIAILERFRAALWYCDLVWCQIAAAESPQPPVRLRTPARS